ncbi:NUDIX hydrolase [Daejeonella oryzae]|uniref:NUDIX hydrolase n=1 Tax=Daejeonella oryzae TaxID=1122943 RepID=UPI0004101247|nr:NUDIX hydrolase [Daejeonella oryzae]
MQELKWKLLTSEYVFKDTWATLRSDTCRMPSGKIIKPYYVLEYPDWVNAVALTHDNQVILIKQYRHAAQEVILEIPGGCIDKGESPEDAVKRELLEETGYVFERIEFLTSLYANPATGNNKTHCFLATGGRKIQEQNLDGGEEIVVELVSTKELKGLLLDNKIGQALHSSGIFYALMHLKLIV